MNKTTFALLLVTIIPLLGLASSKLAKNSFEQDFTEYMERMIDVDPEIAEHWDGVSLEEYCTDLLASPYDDEMEANECRVFGRTGLLAGGSLLTLLLGLGLLGGILYTSHAATMDRNKLLKLFGPSVRLVLFGVFTLILLQTMVITYSILSVEHAILGYTHIQLIIPLMVGGILAALYMIHEGLSAFGSFESDMMGRAVTRQEQPKLWALVDKIAAYLGSESPQNIIVGLEPTFFVTNATIRALPGDKLYRHRTLYLSLPLLRILSRQEINAIIGHELAHFCGEDTKFSMKFYPIYAGSSQALDALYEDSSASFLQSIALWPAVTIMALFLERFSHAESKIGRQRELIADRLGAKVGSAMAIATSLLKVGAYEPYWERIKVSMLDEIEKGGSTENASLAFARLAASVTVPRPLDVMDSEPWAHPTDTHPPTATRIRALGLEPEIVNQASLDPVSPKPATTLIRDVETLEESLTKIEEEIIRDYFSEDEPE